MTIKQVNITHRDMVSLRLIPFVISFIFFYFLLNGLSMAQLRLEPLKTRPYSAQAKSNSAARPMEELPLNLPFWDDFSDISLNANGVPSGIPDESRWQNSKTVWINSGMGINPPSINVATFDGLDSLNQRYEPSQVLLNGFTDKLESKPIDLSVVPLNERNSVYLSFFYQWGGNGEQPDPTDYLQLEFLNKDTVWEVNQTLQIDQIPNDTTFKYLITQVDSAKQRFFHKAFQFRFRRFGRKSGPFDTWNVDYIYLDKNRTDTDANFPDLTIASEITPLFKPYRAVPVKHFFESKYVDDVEFDVFNLRDLTTSTSYNATGKFLNYYPDPTPDKTYTKSIASNVGVNGGLIGPLSKGRAKLSDAQDPPDPNDINEFDPDADSIIVRLKFEVVSGDVLGPFPVNLSSNDTLGATFKLKDYYAYDDGIAEYSVVLNQVGNGAAVLFDMLTEKDTIVALDVYFPDFALEAGLTTNLYIYGDSNGKPGNILGQRTGYSIRSNGLNSFSRILLTPAVPVNNFKFYAGWTETTDGKVKVGLDFSNDSGDKIFVKVGSDWSQNADVRGSLMIRPVFGSADLVTGISEENNPSRVSCYPNPNNGTFFIRGKHDQIQIINTTGQLVPYQAENVNEETKVTLQAAPGLYLVQVRSGKRSRTSKMIIK